ncbi:MAG: hypothetical protein ACYTBV_15530 [Planctomycetota bacterium]
MPEPKNIENAHHIYVDPFISTVDEWAKKTKEYFNYDTLLGCWKVKNLYIAIFRSGEWIDICHVSDEPFVNRNSIPVINIYNDQHQSIHDYKRMEEELNKDPSLGIRIVFYKEKYLLGINRNYFDQNYKNKVVNVEITILEDLKQLNKVTPNFTTKIQIN